MEVGKISQLANIAQAQCNKNERKVTKHFIHDKLTKLDTQSSQVICKDVPKVVDTRFLSNYIRIPKLVSVEKVLSINSLHTYNPTNTSSY